jgi:hypothetical protein
MRAGVPVKRFATVDERQRQLAELAGLDVEL